MFKDEEGLAQLRICHQLHCLERASHRTESQPHSFCAYCTQEREERCLILTAIMDSTSTLIPQKLQVESF